MSAIVLHALVTNYKGAPLHLVGLSDPEKSGNLLVVKEDEFNVKLASQEGHVIVTDSSEMVKAWQLYFDEDVHMDDVIKTYHQRRSSGLFTLSKAVKKYDPHQAIQVGQVNESGIKWRFDSNITNGVIAVLLLIWASSRTNIGQVLSDFHDNTVKDDDGIAPFWF
jgi:hypothetical protein